MRRKAIGGKADCAGIDRLPHDRGHASFFFGGGLFFHGALAHHVEAHGAMADHAGDVDGRLQIFQR